MLLHGGSGSESTSRRQAMEPKPVRCRQKGAKLTRNIDIEVKVNKSGGVDVETN